MIPEKKTKALAAIKRFNGLSKKLEKMIEEDAYCPKILEIALAMKGHIEHVQAQVLESHLQTCAVQKLSGSPSDRESFVHELAKVIGLSRR
jgi:DNA-binding FrmR family transcriptional regulator